MLPKLPHDNQQKPDKGDGRWGSLPLPWCSAMKTQWLRYTQIWQHAFAKEAWAWRTAVGQINQITNANSSNYWIGLDAKSMFPVIPNIPSPANNFLKDSHNLGQASWSAGWRNEDQWGAALTGLQQSAGSRTCTVASLTAGRNSTLFKKNLLRQNSKHSQPSGASYAVRNASEHTAAVFVSLKTEVWQQGHDWLLEV